MEAAARRDWLNQRARRSPDPPDADKETHRVNTKASQVEWLAKAMLLVQKNPGWTDKKIADEVGKHKSTLSRSKVYNSAARMARGNSSISDGCITIDSDGLRDLEAFDSANGDSVDWSHLPGRKKAECAACKENEETAELGGKRYCRECYAEKLPSE